MTGWRRWKSRHADREASRSRASHSTWPPNSSGTAWRPCPVTPGFLRSETMLERFGVTEANWRDAGKKDRNFLESERRCFSARRCRARCRPRRSTAPVSCYSSWELGFARMV